MKLYSVNVRIYGTAYIKADSEEEAREIAKAMKNETLTVRSDGGDTEICGEDYSLLEADVSLSPAMTIHGPDDDEPVEVAYDYKECD